MWVWYIYLQYTGKVKIYISQNQIKTSRDKGNFVLVTGSHNIPLFKSL